MTTLEATQTSAETTSSRADEADAEPSLSTAQRLFKVAFFATAMVATAAWLWLLGWVALALLGY